MINWILVAQITGPILGALVGVLLTILVERRTKLIAYISHVSAFNVSSNSRNGPFQVFTHSIVIRNVGRRTASNVRIGHNTLPDFQVYPPIEYSVIGLPGGEQEIVLPVLVPGEQISISYLYFPPLTWNQVNTNVKSDEGLAKVISVIPTPQPARWLKILIWGLLIIGCIATSYILVEVVLWALL